MGSSKRKGKVERTIKIEEELDRRVIRGWLEILPRVELDFNISHIPSDMQNEVGKYIKKSIEWQLEEIFYQAILSYVKSTLKDKLVASLNGIKIIPSNYVDEGVIICNWGELMNLSKFLEEKGVVLDTVKY